MVHINTQNVFQSKSCSTEHKEQYYATIQGWNLVQQKQKQYNMYTTSYIVLKNNVNAALKVLSLVIPLILSGRKFHITAPV